MCRYSDHRYRTHYVCLNCRYHKKDYPEKDVKCTHCHNFMINVGMDFKPPLKHSDDQWEKLKLINQTTGLNRYFQNCGCGGYGRSAPKTAAEVKHPYLR